MLIYHSKSFTFCAFASIVILHYIFPVGVQHLSIFLYRDLSELNKKKIEMESEQEALLDQREEETKKKMCQELHHVRQEHDHETHLLNLQVSRIRFLIVLNTRNPHLYVLCL